MESWEDFLKDFCWDYWGVAVIPRQCRDEQFLDTQRKSEWHNPEGREGDAIGRKGEKTKGMES